jgi:hypothetical protein
MGSMRPREFFRRWDAHMGRMDAFVERMDVHNERMDAFVERMDGHMARMDGHLARMDGHMARGELLMADIHSEMELTREEVRLSRESRDDLRSFIREINARMERGTQAMIAELRDLREESRAQRQALLRVIDRMDGLDPGGAAAG